MVQRFRWSVVSMVSDFDVSIRSNFFSFLQRGKVVWRSVDSIAIAIENSGGTPSAAAPRKLLTQTTDPSGLPFGIEHADAQAKGIAMGRGCPEREISHAGRV